MNFKRYIFLIIIIISCSCKKEQLQVLQKQKQINQINSEIQQIQWFYNLDEGLKLAKTNNKLVMADFYTEWCYYCEKMDSETFTNSDVIKLCSNFICVKVDCNKYPNEREKYMVMGFPTIIFLDSDNKIIKKIIGYKNSEDFITIMDEIIKKNMSIE